jgi:spore germination protein GerM
VAPEGSAQPLRTVLRDPKGQQELIETLVQGPNEEEFADGLRTQIPVDLDVNGVQFNGGVVEVDVGDEIADLADEDQQLAVAQIVFTASELPGAESVLIEVDGNSRSWPDGDGDLQSDPLTVYDFIGYAESSQPAYPVSPRPPQSPTSTTTTTPTSTTPSITA